MTARGTIRDPNQWCFCAVRTRSQQGLIARFLLPFVLYCRGWGMICNVLRAFACNVINLVNILKPFERYTYYSVANFYSQQFLIPAS